MSLPTTPKPPVAEKTKVRGGNSEEMPAAGTQARKDGAGSGRPARKNVMRRWLPQGTDQFRPTAFHIKQIRNL